MARFLLLPIAAAVPDGIMTKDSMSVFRFSLEQVLVYRTQLEEQAMLVLARAVEARDSRLREKGALEEAVQDTRVKLVATLDADERWLLSGYATALTQDLEYVVRSLISLEEEVDRARSDLTQKAQDRKLLEKLKEKQAARHHLAETHKEQQNYDDIATIRYTPTAV